MHEGARLEGGSSLALAELGRQKEKRIYGCAVAKSSRLKRRSKKNNFDQEQI